MAYVMKQAQSIRCEAIRINGLVQGVGFRPFVWRLARQWQLSGEVLNDGQGVHILAQGDSRNLENFITAIECECPPLARIDSLEREHLADRALSSEFRIAPSQATAVATGIVADAATCQHCLDDITTPGNRRNGYAFTNCTHCGPRLSIVNDIPYDRANTSMHEFELCWQCNSEYKNPENRRFHAQPNACPKCGPQLSLLDPQGNPVVCSHPVAAVAQQLRNGEIVLIKGLGGYQYACDATNSSAIEKLRQIKNRPIKPLALMAADVEQINQYCVLSTQQISVLLSPAAPIVLLDKSAAAETLAQNIAPNIATLGFMLPATPLHHLLMQKLDAPIVLTSGNFQDEPQCIDDRDILNHAHQFAVSTLSHNRRIVNRIDDSVVRVSEGRLEILRRARGYAPMPIVLPPGFSDSVAVLACGAELQNTFCLLSDNKAMLSPHIGNLENAASYADYLEQYSVYQRIFQFEPEVVAVDSHPEYLSSKFGRQLHTQNGATHLFEVQHHHAHIAACLADNLWPRDGGKVIGIAMDGLGYGDDGSLWGGEFLVADYVSSIRVGRLNRIAMPGATQAISQPWRNTVANLVQHPQWGELAERYKQLGLMQYFQSKPLTSLTRMIQTAQHAPLSSSCGRLFDAVAAAAGICRDEISYQAQAAIELEHFASLANIETLTPYPFTLVSNEELTEISTLSLWPELLNDLQHDVSRQVIAARFHLGLAQAIAEMAVHLANVHQLKTVALSGGVFHNRVLRPLCSEYLLQAGLNVLTHSTIPAGDGGLSLGQAVIASARHSMRKEKCV